MAKILLLCWREGFDTPCSNQDLTALADRLTPPGFQVAVPQITHAPGLTIATFFSGAGVEQQGTSVCIGVMVGDARLWWKPGSPAPEGSFGLYRADDGAVELVTDTVASRTIWYVHTPDLFIASTSQRAIIYILRSFVPNRAAVTWMLTSGCLGPGESWDERIRCVPPDSHLRLDRASWKIELQEAPVEFAPVAKDAQLAQKELTDVLESLVEELRVENWVLSLSGGCDSRALLLLLKRHMPVTCVTWGISQNYREPDNDCFLAAETARESDVRHLAFEVDQAYASGNTLDYITQRFLVSMEGRVHNFWPSLNLESWTELKELGYSGLIRGDEGFGWMPVKSEVEARACVGIVLPSDIKKMPSLPSLELPSRLKRRSGESEATWRDRLYHQFRLPTWLAAYNDWRGTFFETVNPLISGRIIMFVRRLPDEMRTGKKLFRNIVESLDNRVPFAKRSAWAGLSNIAKMSYDEADLREALGGEEARALLSSEVAEIALNALGSSDPSAWFDQLICGRAYLVSSMYRLLAKDAKHDSMATVEELRASKNALFSGRPLGLFFGSPN